MGRLRSRQAEPVAEVPIPVAEEAKPAARRSRSRKTAEPKAEVAAVPAAEAPAAKPARARRSRSPAAEQPAATDLDEKVARLHLKKIGAKLTELQREQADYIGVAVEGPFKPEHYRY